MSGFLGRADLNERLFVADRDWDDRDPPTHTHTTLDLNKATVLLLLCGKVDML